MYESWFRFRRRPFAAAPRVDDYYPAESSESARKSLISCVQRGAGPGLLIGSAGSGKSTLCHQLLGHFRTRTAVALISCSGLTTRRALFQNILFELGRPYRDLDEGELRLSLIDYLTSRDASHSGTVLLFDDAHHLNVELFEDLRMLSSIVRDGNWCVHVVLSGNVRLEEILSVPNLESFNQRIAARCYLEPFRNEETAAYIRRQFDRVEGHADDVFIAGALSAIHKFSGGTPRLINQLCDHALLLAATASRSQLDEHGIREAWSDLQHLPPPEKDLKTSVDEIIEFGSLDQETFANTAAEIAVTEPVEETKIDREPQHPLSQESPQRPFETSAARINNASPLGPEFEVDTMVQFDEPESFDLETMEADRLEAEPMNAAQIDAEKCLDVLEAHLNRYNDGVHLPTTENPFLEEFAEEEVIVDRPSSLLNRVVNCQPPVTSQCGQELQTALDRFSLAAAKGQPWQLASEIGSPRSLVSTVDSVDDVEDTDENRLHGNAVADATTADNVFPDSIADEYADDGDTRVEEGVRGDVTFENPVDFTLREVAVPEVDVPEFAIPEATVVSENATIEMAVSDDMEQDVTERDEIIADRAVTEEAVTEEAVTEEAIFEEADSEEPVSTDVVLDTIVENGEVVEVFEVERGEHPSDTFCDYVAQCDTESWPERELKSSFGEIHPTGKAMKKDEEPLPRNAKPGRRLNRLFSNLADREK